MLLEAKKDAGVNHYHIIYIRPDGTALVTESNGHTHELSMTAGSNGQQLPSIEPAGKKPHTHAIGNIEEKETIDEDNSDDEELHIISELYREAAALDAENNKYADIDAKMYAGDQWEKADRDKLKAEDRACLDLNEIKPKLDLLSGYQSRNRTDINLMPVENGDTLTAEAYNYAIKSISQMSSFDQKEIEIFDENIQEGRSFFNVRIGLSRNLVPEVIIERKTRRKVFTGAHEELDGSDMEYAGFFDHISKARLKELYPDKAEEIEADYDYMVSYKENIKPKNKNQYYTGRSMPALEDNTLVDIAKQNYKIIEVQRKIYKRTPTFFNTNHNFYFTAANIPKDKIRIIKSIEELNLIIDVDYYIQVGVFAGNVLLRKEKSLLKEISLVPVYCNKKGDKWWGKVRDAAGAQIELNKRRSQIIDIVNKMASYGIGFSPAAFDNPRDAAEFEAKRNKPGFSQVFADGFKEHLHEFQGVKFPSEVANASQLSSASISTSLNVYPEMLGDSSSASASGAALSIKTRQGLLGNEFLFNNLSLSKKRLARLLINAIQVTSSPEKLLRLMENQNNQMFSASKKSMIYPETTPQEKLQLAVSSGMMGQADAMGIAQLLQSGQPLPPEVGALMNALEAQIKNVHREKLLAALNNMELADYDVAITESPSSPSMMFTNYLIISDMFRGNPNAPYSELIKLIPNLGDSVKKSLLDALGAQQQASAQSEQMKYATEIEKTKIAQAGKMNKDSSGTTGTAGQ